jgi:hypothetical protein
MNATNVIPMPTASPDHVEAEGAAGRALVTIGA